MKRHFFAPALVAIAVAIMVLPAFAQSDDKNASDQSGFINHARQINSAEIQLGCLALSRSDNPDVRPFANMMIQDHWQAEQRIRETLGQTADDSDANPTQDNAAGGRQSCKAMQETNQLVGLRPEDEQLYNRLSRMSGTEFDREYLAAVVRNHRKDVQEFENEAKLSGNEAAGVREKPGTSGDASDVARYMLRTLQKHLAAAETLQRQLAR